MYYFGSVLVRRFELAGLSNSAEPNDLVYIPLIVHYFVFTLKQFFVGMVIPFLVG